MENFKIKKTSTIIFILSVLCFIFISPMTLAKNEAKHQLRTGTYQVHSGVSGNAYKSVSINSVVMNSGGECTVNYHISHSVSTGKAFPPTRTVNSCECSISVKTNYVGWIIALILAIAGFIVLAIEHNKIKNTTSSN